MLFESHLWGCRLATQPVLQKMGHCQGASCPVAEGLARRGFYVPSGLALTSDEIARVATELRAIMAALVSK
jgi:perosamine synthetase